MTGAGKYLRFLTAGLAAAGLVSANAASSPVCTPSRALFCTAVRADLLPSAQAEAADREVFAMDTYMTIHVNGTGAAAAADAAAAEISRLDALLSTELEGSEVSRINRDGGGILSPDVRELAETSLKLFRETGGAFDISVYPVMELWGFPGHNCHVPSDDSLAAALKLTGADNIRYDSEKSELRFLQPGMKIDFGGIAKGYASSRVTALLRDLGIDSAMVNLGGNVQVLGRKPDGTLWKVGIRDPENTDGLLGVLSAEDTAVITSGGYERCFQENGKTYHHIIDPKTGRPAEKGIVSATVVCPDGILADGLSTSLYIMGESEAVSFWRSCSDPFEMILMTEDGRLLATEGLENSFRSDRTVTWIRKN